MTLEQQIDSLADAFREQITEAFTAAYAVEEPAGATPEWLALCQRLGVTPVSDQERGEIRAAQKPLRGAPAMELLEVIKAIVKPIRRKLKKMDTFDAPGSTDVKHTRLQNLLDRTSTELIAAYRTAVLPKQAGGMFANVFASHQAPAQQAPVVTSLTCPHCGAPRLNPKDFDCAYCGQRMI